MSGFKDPVQGGVAGTSTIDDNTDPSVLFESEDGKDYIKIDTTDGSEVLTLKAGGSTATDGENTPKQLQIDSAGTVTIGSTEGDISIGGASAKISFARAGGVAITAAHASGALYFQTGGSNNRLGISADGKFSTGGETTPLCPAGGIHLKIADSGLAAPNGSFDDLVIEGSGATGLTFSAPANSGIRFQKDGNTDHHGITFDSGTSSIRTRLGAVDRLYIDDAGRVKWQSSGVQYHAGTGSDTATSEPLYLADTNATMIIDCRKGNCGDITLAANVTAIKFWFAPSDGSVFTLTAKITQHGSSAKTIDYADSAVTVYSDGGSTAVTGEMKWSGGVHHTMSTGTSDVDIVQFTIFPNGTTFDVFAAVIGQDFS